MKAIVCRQYGSPDLLTCEEIERPVPGDGEVLVAVRAASVNPLDWHFMRGTPRIARLMTGLRAPRVTRPGVDLAGRVEAVGRGVTLFRPGDEVFGVSRGGSFAEYVCAKELKLALKPANVTFEQAAAVPVAGVTALQGLRDKGRLRPGQRVLVNGAAGGVGSFAVQIAKSLGAEVTGVCSTGGLDLVRSIGADRVLDYTREDFARGVRRYDVILDCVWTRSVSECRRVTSPGGIYVVAGAPPSRAFTMLLLSPLLRGVIIYMASIKQADLVALRELMEAAHVTPAIDRCYPLSEAAAAVRHLAAGHAHGKVVITVP